MTTVPAVYAAISECSAILMRNGIAKSRTASMGKGAPVGALIGVIGTFRPKAVAPIEAPAAPPGEGE